MDSAEELERGRLVVASGQTDFDRWRDLSNFSPLWDGRAEAAGRWIPSQPTVLDLGCGRMARERFLPGAVTYYPNNLSPRDERTLVASLDLEPPPDVPCIWANCTIGVAECPGGGPRCYRQVCSGNAHFITSYHPYKTGHVFHRPSLAWVNSLTFRAWIAAIPDAQFEITDRELLSTGQDLLACDPI